MDEARFALEALHKEAQAREAERKLAEQIAMRLAHEKAVEAANLQRAQMAEWQRQARQG